MKHHTQSPNNPNQNVILETLIALITSAKPKDVKENSTVSTTIVVFITTTLYASAGRGLDVELQEKILLRLPTPII